jgi:hypothetical protein
MGDDTGAGNRKAATPSTSRVGRAYGIFKSRCAEGGIVTNLETMRPSWRHELLLPLREPITRTETRYVLCHTTDVKEGGAIIKEVDEQLSAIALEWQGRGANYVLKLSVPGSTNEKTAGELQAFLSALNSECLPLIEKIENAVAAAYFMEDSGLYTCRIIGG